MMETKTYRELSLLRTFKERFEYLKVLGVISNITFGSDRYLNQILYSSDEWKLTRNRIILRDNGCDLGIEGRDIFTGIVVHHINPLTVDDILENRACLFDQDNLICCSDTTHKLIHYGTDISLLDFKERRANDTIPWK